MTIRGRRRELVRVKSAIIYRRNAYGQWSSVQYILHLHHNRGIPVTRAEIMRAFIVFSCLALAAAKPQYSYSQPSSFSSGSSNLSPQIVPPGNHVENNWKKPHDFIRFSSFSSNIPSTRTSLPPTCTDCHKHCAKTHLRELAIQRRSSSAWTHRCSFSCRYTFHRQKNLNQSMHQLQLWTTRNITKSYSSRRHHQSKLTSCNNRNKSVRKRLLSTF